MQGRPAVSRHGKVAATVREWSRKTGVQLSSLAGIQGPDERGSLTVPGPLSAPPWPYHPLGGVSLEACIQTRLAACGYMTSQRVLPSHPDLPVKQASNC